MMQIRQREAPADTLAETGLHPVIQRIYAARGLTSPDTLTLELSDLLPPQQLSCIENAVDLLTEQLQSQGHILIVGDFDADGATSSALGMLCLKALGFQNVSYLVPNRFEYGYGLTPEIAAVACEYNPALLMTVDNGISSHEGVALVKKLGVRTLITDHHLPGASVPDADCILNPNQDDDDFPSKALAGVGVVFYLMMALRARLRQDAWFAQQGIEEPNLAQYLDIVALGTVADVVPLDRNNRCLVRHGLKVIQSGQGRPGIRALLEVAGRDLTVLSASDLGFAAGPRLNAAGRLDDMSLGIECLLTENEQTAWRIARQLDDMNRDRRNIEQHIQQEAMTALESLPVTDLEQPGICLFSPDWHQGVIGIVASRLKEKFHRPAIVFADTGEGGLIKGSARSIPGIHIRDLLEVVDVSQPGLISGYGGHAMAAGLSLPVDRFAAFSEAFQEALSRVVDPETLQQNLWTDGPLSPVLLNADFAQALEEAGPWGQHFPEPLFEGRFSVMQQRVVGEKHLKLKVAAGDAIIDAIAFNQPDELLTMQHNELDLIYRLTRNAWAGKVTAQLVVEHIQTV